MSNIVELSAKPIQIVVDEQSSSPVGVLYLWNTGCTSTKWFGEPVEGVRYEDLPSSGIVHARTVRI